MNIRSNFLIQLFDLLLKFFYSRFRRCFMFQLVFKFIVFVSKGSQLTILVNQLFFKVRFRLLESFFLSNHFFLQSINILSEDNSFFKLFVSLSKQIFIPSCSLFILVFLFCQYLNSNFKLAYLFSMVFNLMDELGLSFLMLLTTIELSVCFLKFKLSNVLHFFLNQMLQSLNSDISGVSVISICSWFHRPKRFNRLDHRVMPLCIPIRHNLRSTARSSRAVKVLESSEIR